jgi:glycosyltransferase involved in cell wall biosynthesis
LTSVSILLPFHNAADTLAETLDCIRGQTLTDYELVAVDDGSTDQSARLVRQAAQSDERIRLLQPGRVGLVRALNLGLAACRSELVARMDADDHMHPQRLRKQCDYLRDHPDIQLLATRVEMFPPGAVQEGYREYLRWQNSLLDAESIAAEIYVESPFVHPSVMFRREAVLKVGAYREGYFPEDYELWLRMHHAGMNMAKLPELLLSWRESPGRLSRTDDHYARDAFDRLRAEYLARDPRLPGDRPLAYWGAGRRTRLRANLLIEKGFPSTAWIDIDPKKIGNRIDGVPVVGPDWLADRADRPFVLSYVTNHGARELISRHLEEMGYRRGRDYLPVG